MVLEYKKRLRTTAIIQYIIIFLYHTFWACSENSRWSLPMNVGSAWCAKVCVGVPYRGKRNIRKFVRSRFSTMKNYLRLQCDPYTYVLLLLLIIIILLLLPNLTTEYDSHPCNTNYWTREIVEFIKMYKSPAWIFYRSTLSSHKKFGALYLLF